MDIIFNCPKCEQELAVDSTGAGTEIECPTCHELITVPEPETLVPPGPDTPVAPSVKIEPHIINPIAASAAAKEEKHLRVPVHEGPAERLIEKPPAPLEVAAKGEKHLRVKTIRHTDCIEVGHDRFDEVVSEFLRKVGDENVVSITGLSYTFLDIGTQKLMTEYAVMIVYKG
jgi:DNA-directed RNA polymerase subunit RPC12/RpoP